MVNNYSYTVFNQIAYLGSATVNAPRSESELQRNMAILSRQSSGQPIEVTLLIPSSADGTVMYELLFFIPSSFEKKIDDWVNISE